MKIRHVLLLLLICLNSSPLIHATEIKQLQDSLAQQLKQTTIVEDRLGILKRLAILTEDELSCLPYLQQMQIEIKKTKIPDWEEWMYRGYVRFYYNRGNADSAAYYASCSDSLAKATGRYTDNYFDAQTFYCQYLLWENQMEKATDLAIRLHNTAKEKENENGLVCSSENLGLIYQKLGQDSVAVDFFNEALKLIEKKPGEERYVAQLLTNLIESELKLDRPTSTYQHIKQLETQTNRLRNGDFGQHPSFPYNRCYLFINAYYINLFVREKKMESAKKQIEIANTYFEKEDNPYIRYYYQVSLANFYNCTNQYIQALQSIDGAIELEKSPETMKLRADILLNMGRTHDASIQYKEALQLNQEMNNMTFVRQLSQLHTMYSINGLELQVKELRVKELELETRQLQLKWTTVFITILCITLIIGAYAYLHNNKLKNELQKDKLILQKSDRELRIARDKAEESDRLKSVFLSNMSHEIRTPLNAISGFAQLLECGDDLNGEQKEYTHIITENSALLLNLVNDILDISRLESEKYHFTFTKENLTLCCQSALNSMINNIKPGVKIKFLPEVEDFQLTTDKFRLQQILINLLGNAAKFTEKGIIELAFTIDNNNGLVRFTITDTGCGVPKDKQEAIFERFEKLNECIQGSGLGLSICRVIAKRLKGDVALDKDYTGGARFIFTHSLNL